MQRYEITLEMDTKEYLATNNLLSIEDISDYNDLYLRNYKVKENDRISLFTLIYPNGYSISLNLVSDNQRYYIETIVTDEKGQHPE